MTSDNKSNIQEPFDPSSIDVEKKNISINSLITMLQNDIIDLSPAFQRKKDLWDDTKQSQLIESLLLKLPLPSMYFEYDNVHSKYVVIDGLQRLCAIKHFAVDKDLRLTGLEFIAEDYDGLGYNDLTFQDKLSIGLEEITVNTFKKGTPKYAKFIIFKRLNSGGLELKKQEIRNALYPGDGLDMVQRISQDATFKSVGFKSDRMSDRECILRYFAFLNIGVTTYTGKMESFLNQALWHLNTLEPSALDVLEQGFHTALRRNLSIFGAKAFRIPGKRKGRPSASLFDVLMVEMSRIDQATYDRLENNKQAFVDAINATFTADSDFKDSVGSKSDRKYSTQYRYNNIRQQIKRFAK